MAVGSPAKKGVRWPGSNDRWKGEAAEAQAGRKAASGKLFLVGCRRSASGDE